jgi:hypothetical protein
MSGVGLNSAAQWGCLPCSHADLLQLMHFLGLQPAISSRAPSSRSLRLPFRLPGSHMPLPSAILQYWLLPAMLIPHSLLECYWPCMLLHIYRCLSALLAVLFCRHAPHIPLPALLAASSVCHYKTPHFRFLCSSVSWLRALLTVDRPVVIGGYSPG